MRFEVVPQASFGSDEHGRPTKGQVGQKRARERRGERSRELPCAWLTHRGGETAADHWWTAKPGRLGGGEATRSTPQVGKARRRWRRRRRRGGGGSVADSGSGTGSDMKRRQKRAEEQEV